MNEIQVTEKERNTNLDALRIISMLMVLTLHYLSKGGLLESKNVTENQYIIYWFLECLSIVAVNCYVLISGFFLVKSEFKMKKILKLWGEVLFYSVLVYVITITFGLKEFNIIEAVKSCLPVITKRYWFVNSYLALYVLSPYINRLIMALKKEELKKMLLILIIIFSIMTVLPSEMTLDSTEGYGIIWFICLYLIGAYIKLYIEESKKKKNKYLFAYLVISIVLTIGILFIQYISNKLGIKDVSKKLLAYNNFLVLMQSISLFLYFRNIEIKKECINKIILLIAPLTFSVYIIHEQPIFSSILYTKLLQVDKFYNNQIGLPVTIISIILVFVICVLIEKIRIKILNVIRNKNDFI